MKKPAPRFSTLAAALATVALLSDCGGGGGYGGGGSPSGGVTYTVGGVVTGLASSDTVVLQNNGGDNLTITMDGSFTFATALPYLAGYHVTVLTQPAANKSCTVSNDTGTVPLTNVTNVTVQCVFIPVQGDLVITEVLANPAGGQQAKEWFEVFNTSPNTLQLDGMVVTANAGTFTVPALVAIPSGAHFVFAASGDMNANAGLAPVNVVYGGALTLTDTSLTLTLTYGGTQLDAVTFATSTAGKSLSLDPGKQDPISNDNPANFCVSTSPYGDLSNSGTPGAPGPSCP